NLRRILAFRQWEPNFEPDRNVLRAGHGNEDRVKIGAIAALRITGPESIALAPSSATLVITHGGEGVVIERAGFFHFRHFRLYLLRRNLGRTSGDGNEFVRRQKTLQLFF